MKSHERREAWREGGLVFVCCLAAVLIGCDRKAPASFERPPAPVTVATAITRDVPIYLDAIGKTVARAVVTIKPQVSGRIVKIQFTDGADVKVGELLFTIDPRPYQAQLNAAKANLAQARAQLELAKINFDRVASITDPRAVSRQDYDTKKNAVAVAEAQVAQSEAAVETAQVNLDYCTIRSPIDGRTGQRLVDLGNVVTADNTPLVVIQRLDPIYADFTITESDLTAVQRNMAQGTLKVEVSLPDDPGSSREGKLTFLDNSVQETSGTVKLRGTIANGDHRFWPGRFVNIRLILSMDRGAILVPADAPEISATGPFVYVVNKDSTAELRPVELGQRQGDLVVVRKGVRSGERVVVTGQLRVTPGGKVSVAEAAAPGTKPTANGQARL
jgi:multidrug efflux system membrane fusion protein